MSRLDSFIRRLQAQRSCLARCAELIANMPGPVFEIGLGNGRTYDHLKEICPRREIYVFERKVAAHPDCVPPADRLFEGPIEETLPILAGRFGGVVALIHADIGSGRAEVDRRITDFLSSQCPIFMRPGGILLTDMRLVVPRCELLPLPEGVAAGRYSIYRQKAPGMTNLEPAPSA